MVILINISLWDILCGYVLFGRFLGYVYVSVLRCISLMYILYICIFIDKFLMFILWVN